MLQWESQFCQPVGITLASSATMRLSVHCNHENLKSTLMKQFTKSFISEETEIAQRTNEAKHLRASTQSLFMRPFLCGLTSTFGGHLDHCVA